MVRLQSSEQGEGAHPQVVDLLLNSAAGNKRTRAQTSSLDYKISSGSTNRAGNEQTIVTTAKVSGSEKQRQHKESGNQNGGQLPQQQQQRPKIATRARGSSGIPPRKAKLELSDLQGMTEEQIMQALYADPELAELAAEQITQAQMQSNQKHRKAGGIGSNSSKASGSRADKIIKENGFPYEQWLVLLVIVGFGFYHLYKSMSGKTGHVSKIKREGSLPKGKSKHSWKSKNFRGINPASSKKKDSISTAVESSDDADVDKVVAEIEGISTKSMKSIDASNATTKKSNKVKKKKKPVSSSKLADNRAENSQSKDDEGTSNMKVTNSAPQLYASTVIGVEDYGDHPVEADVWETVSKSKNNSSKVKNLEALVVEESKTTIVVGKIDTVKSSTKLDIPKEDVEVAKADVTPAIASELEPSQVQESDGEILITVNGATQAPVEEKKLENVEVPNLNTSTDGSPNKNGKENGSIKKKKKKKLIGVSGIENGRNENTDADAEYALKLQKEEEKLAELEEQKQLAAALAASSVGEKQEIDDWAEVITKKKKSVMATKLDDIVE